MFGDLPLKRLPESATVGLVLKLPAPSPAVNGRPTPGAAPQPLVPQPEEASVVRGSWIYA